MQPTFNSGLRAASFVIFAAAPDCKSGVSDIPGSNPRQSTTFNESVAQSGRAPVSKTGGSRFDPVLIRHRVLLIDV